MPVATSGVKDPVRVGSITHRFKPISCVGIKVKGAGFQEGDELLFEKHASTKDSDDFFSQQVITSIELNHSRVNEALPGQEVAVKVNLLPPNGTKVFVLKKPEAAAPA